jgi:hypothetical protein
MCYLTALVRRVSKHQRRHRVSHNADHAHDGNPSCIFQQRDPVRYKVSGHLGFC